MEKMKKISRSIVAIVALIAIVSGCNGSSDIVEPPTQTYDYTLKGCFVQDINLSNSKVDYNYFAAKMTRNLENLSTAQLFFGSSALVYDKEFNIADSVYTFSTAVQSYRRGAVTTINIADAALFGDTVSTFVLDSLWIKNSQDSSLPNTNGTQVPIGWSATANVDGYVVAVVLAESAYTGIGYSAYVTDLSPSTTIPPDAFRVNPLQPDPDTGWYNIYVYGYQGSPDVALSSELLPVPFPSQLSNNVNHTNLIGNFGSITVSSKVMIHVGPF